MDSDARLLPWPIWVTFGIKDAFWPKLLLCYLCFLCRNVWVIEWVSAAICFENLACQICRHRSFSCLLYSFFALYSKTFCTWLLWNIIVVRIEGFKLAFIILSIIFRNLVGFFGYVPGCLNPVFCSHLLIWWVGDDFVNWFVEGCCHGQWCKLRRHLPPSRMFMQL